ncbi:hypothetical protein ElyMa_003121000 [Elysia marginata]|uniref:PiggyBac transposable element-derived protein domain-containing protein n=1 Tax=Elysia marginata TaxID=1093978 RepID=A0AAV4IRS5_9GAST|nr:hypothetical protein ElyMa_003121000 [Elysia marginata]
MASGSGRPSRYTAHEVRNLFQNMSDESDSDSDLVLEPEGSDSLIESDSSDPSSDRESKSQPPSKRARTANAGGPSASTSSDPDLPIWNEVMEGVTDINFRFSPPNGSGLQANLNETSTALDCFRVFMTQGVVQFLLNSVNAYADHRCRINNPPRRQSVFNSWYKLSECELYKFFAIVIQMGLDPAPAVRDYYCRKYAPSYRPWFHKILPWPRFEAIYHSMFHCAQEAEATAKDKIEPYLNLLLQNFRSAFYPFQLQELSLDEMVVGFTESWVSRLTRTAAEVMDPRGDDKSGCRSECLEFLDGFQDVKSRFCSFRANRFNNVFENASAIVFYQHHIVSFLEDFVSHSNLKSKNDAMDLQDEKIMDMMRAFSKFNFLVTSPYWKLMNSNVPYSSRNYKNYTEETLLKVVNECKKVPIKDVAQVYNIPIRTLRKKVNGLHSKTVGGQTVLTPELEEAVMAHVLKCADYGMPLSPNDIKFIMKGMLDKMKLNVPKFKSNLPGPDWIKAFLSRPEDQLCQRNCQNIKRSRAQVDPEQINKYFRNLQRTLAGVPPENILNYDETDEPGQKSVFCEGG